MIIFTDALLIGNGQIDTEHKMLFDLINAAHHQIEEQHCSIENAMQLIHNLENYVDTHFTHEENYMLSINDPEYPIQLREHNVFRSKISEYNSINITDESHALLVLDELLTFLGKWLYRHIASSDTLIGKVPALKEEEVKDVFDFPIKFHSGIPFIDEEHHWLFSLIQKSYDALHKNNYSNEVERLDDVMSIVEELSEYTKKHFAHEEEYMKAVNYSKLEEQQKAHTAFIYKLEDVNEEVGQEDARDYLEDLVEFLLFWLSNHILHEDLQIPYDGRVLANF